MKEYACSKIENADFMQTKHECDETNNNRHKVQILEIPSCHCTLCEYLMREMSLFINSDGA